MLEQFKDRLVPTALTIPTNLSGAAGTIIQVPIDVDTLSEAASGNEGLGVGEMVVFYDPQVFTVASTDVLLGTIATGGSTAINEGYSPTTPNGWTTSNSTVSAGYLDIVLTNDGSGYVTDSGSGSLVVINFHINPTAPLGATNIDLAADSYQAGPMGSAGFTGISDYLNSFNPYTLNPAPQDNATNLTPYTYSGSDPCDGIVTVTGAAPHLSVNAPATATAGVPFDVTVSARQQQ